MEVASLALDLEIDAAEQVAMTDRSAWLDEGLFTVQLAHTSFPLLHMVADQLGASLDLVVGLDTCFVGSILGSLG
ncbi:MAG TPA: hypothetical protein VHA52_04730 [Candidatus Babeliaceae bacterium]|nr:hypothetical protein [Candidatus Babeliaceae bacterium]